MELFVEVDVVDGLGGGDDALGALLVEVDRIHRVVQVHSHKAWVGLALKNVGIVVPEV